MSYDRYTLSDFVLDDYFQAYVLCTDSEAVAFWTHWRARNPHREQEVQEAAELIRLLNGPKNRLPLPDQGAELRRLVEQMDAEGAAVHDLKVPHPFAGRARWLGSSLAAAVVALLFLAGAGWVLTRLYAEADQVVIKTAYGQKRLLRLPDGSEVMLNANTTLRYSPDWPINGDREVALDGEAYFRVSKRRVAGRPVKFTVRVGDLGIEVVGTEFNVQHWAKRTQVVLETGKVRLRATASHQPLLDLTPGEAATYSPQDHALNRQRVDIRRFNAWRENRLVFDNTPLSEVAETIRNTYGKTVTFADTDLMSRRLTGTIPDDDLSRLTQALATAFDLRITVRDDAILIQSR
ncbi:FecR family protein [Salmonirosea aquatica]